MKFCIFLYLGLCSVYEYTICRRRINTAGKTKVIAAVWGAAFIQFLAALTIMPKTILNSSFSFKSSWSNSPVRQTVPVQKSWRGKEFNKFCAPNRSDDLCLIFCLYPSSMKYAMQVQWRQKVKGKGKCRYFHWLFFGGVC